MREVAKVWRPGVSKVQYRMALIGADGAQLGTAIPQFPPRDDPERLRRAYLRTLAYTTPPGSGNAYARDFVERAYAIAPPAMRWSDDVLLTLAPLLGDVLTIRKPLACYRIHDANDAALSSLDAAKFRRRLLQDVEKARLFEIACQETLTGGNARPPRQWPQSFAIPPRLVPDRAFGPPIPERHRVKARLPPGVFGGDIVANAPSGPGDPARLGRRLRVGATASAHKPGVMAFRADLAARGDQAAAGSPQFSARASPARAGMNQDLFAEPKFIRRTP